MSDNTYQLHICLSKPTTITIGKLGVFTFPAGEYIYTGSARRNIESRIARHLRHEKRLRWHIDYLLADPASTITQVEISDIPECQLNRNTTGEVIVAKFGASDCKKGCVSHLKYRGVASAE